MKNLKVKTKGSREVLDITDRVSEHISADGIRSGLVHLFILHTTACLTTADLDPGTDLDMIDAFEAMMPKLRYRHPHDPEHVTEHILSSVIGPTVLVPVKEGKLVLGTWQRVVLIEMSGPRDREIMLSTIPENV